MKNVSNILIVDDLEQNRFILKEILTTLGHQSIEAENGKEAMEILNQTDIDLILLDFMMPDMDGEAVLTRVKESATLKAIPVLMISAIDEMDQIVRCIELGADDYLAKPFSPVILRARIKSCLQKKYFYDKEKEYLDQIEENNSLLEEKVATQLLEIEKKNRLEKYFSANIVKALMADSEAVRLSSSREKLTVLFSDVRGFTSLTESMEPEETIEILNEYLSEMTKLIFLHEGTLNKFLGDGIMVFFGNPIPQEDHALKAVKLAIDMQNKLIDLQKQWFKDGKKPLTVGIGINSGYMTVGNIGSEKHMEYTVIGSHVNLAARLQAIALEGEIIISHSTYGQLKNEVEVIDTNQVEVKGFQNPIIIYKVKF